MTVFARIRAGRSSWGARALALFVCAWLNVALLPCTMAAEPAGEHDCPHCPPDTGMHHDMPGATPTPCGVAADCAAAHELNYDGRTARLELDPPSDHLIAIVPHPLAASPPPDAPCLPAFGLASLHSGAAPPLHLLHCVFLN